MQQGCTLCWEKSTFKDYSENKMPKSGASQENSRTNNRRDLKRYLQWQQGLWSSSGSVTIYPDMFVHTAYEILTAQKPVVILSRQQLLRLPLLPSLPPVPLTIPCISNNNLFQMYHSSPAHERLLLSSPSPARHPIQLLSSQFVLSMLSCCLVVLAFSLFSLSVSVYMAFCLHFD